MFLKVDGGENLAVPELGRDEAMPCNFSHYHQSRIGDGVHGPLHRRGVNWIGRNGHRSLHYVPQLAVTQISQPAGVEAV